MAETTVPAAARTLALFEVFAREKRELTKSELARLLDLPESSCSDLLNTVFELGYVARSNGTKRYYPTGRLLVAAKAIAEHDPLSLFGAEATSLLGSRVNETCTFGVLEGDRVKIMSTYEGSHRLRYVVNVGDRVSIHSTAIGKALLGTIGADERSRLLRLNALRKLTEFTKVEAAEIERDIDDGARRGWYQSQGEGIAEVWSLAIGGLIAGVPVGLSMVGPKERMAAKHEQFVAALEEVNATLFERHAGSPDEPVRRRGARVSE
ncbi:helix-turn-helix domain-containing protein [Sphingomonas sp. MG17]|uniref:Helix-turn-helix domain-containing protein n=1 Tax=Sphingomonas tagetis TaxID=2949092 RepID=A0A9X2HI41_9SPHN|nr:helix-turn-helix domain-containing protein [Sphingomonas tagetis]